jgi:2-polyprenyl-6-methoxyphenol hydroxylase-like FAD-dependent oxidoreductase
MQLQRFGGRFRIIDKLDERTRESRALAVQARSLELLQMFGLARLWSLAATRALA